MIMYGILAVWPLFLKLFFQDIEKNPKKKKAYCVLCAIGLILIVGLRSKYLGSNDTESYYDIMKQTIKSKKYDVEMFDEKLEQGFTIFVWLLSRVFRKAQWIIVISSAIYISSFTVFVYKRSKNVSMSITMFVCLGILTFCMQGMRQAIAMSICLLAYYFVEKKWLIPFILAVLLAITFHQSAIIFFVVYLFNYFKVKPAHIFIVVFGIISTIFLSDYIVQTANDYFQREYTGTVSSGGFIAVAVYLIIIGFTAFISKKTMRFNVDSRMFCMLLFGFVCFIERYIGSQASERISFYFAISQAIILPNAIEEGNISKRDKFIISIIVYTLCVGLFLYRLLNTKFLPYYFFWELRN